MDVNTLSGVDFEKLCQQLLQKYEFDVETTKQSGDGGIDLVAFCRKPFVSGKYIVQCKRYNGGVGEPIVRDLYGVVMSERANKGILITTGYFSMSAIKFAQDKNLELIDGEQLAELLGAADLLGSGSVHDLNIFTKKECFDTNKYEFFKSMITQNKCTAEIARDFILKFLFAYLIRNGNTDEINAMIHAGFAEEYLRLFDWYVGKYHKRGKEQLEILPYYIHKYKGAALLYNFDIFEYVQSRYDILKNRASLQISYTEPGLTYARKYYLSRIPDEHRNGILANLFNTDVIQYCPSYKFYELMNMRVLFKYFNIQEGLDHIDKLMYGNAPDFQRWILAVYRNHESHGEWKIHYATVRPVRYMTRGGQAKYDHVEIKNDEGSFEIKSYFDQYFNQHKEKIDEEICKIKALIRTLE